MIKLFLDSDVIISSLYSSRGAAYQLINHTRNSFYISSASLRELEIVTQRLNINKNKLDKIVKDKFKVIDINLDTQEIIKKYGKYVFDKNDAHIIAGTDLSKVPFLISYNLKHYQIEVVKRDLGIIIITPGIFLQYLRSLS